MRLPAAFLLFSRSSNHLSFAYSAGSTGSIQVVPAPVDMKPTAMLRAVPVLDVFRNRRGRSGKDFLRLLAPDLVPAAAGDAHQHLAGLLMRMPEIDDPRRKGYVRDAKRLACGREGRQKRLAREIFGIADILDADRKDRAARLEERGGNLFDLRFRRRLRFRGGRSSTDGQGNSRSGECEEDVLHGGAPVSRSKDAEKRLHFSLELIGTRRPFFAELSFGLAAFAQIQRFPSTQI